MEVFHWKLLEDKTLSGTYVHLWWEVEHLRSNTDKVKITQKDDQDSKGMGKYLVWGRMRVVITI